MSRLVGERTGLTVKVTFDDKAEGGVRKKCGLVEGSVPVRGQSHWRDPEAGSPGNTQGPRPVAE